MIISDLNYVEAVAEASEVEGGLLQILGIGQVAIAAAGNNSGNGISLDNIADAVNVAILTVVGNQAFTLDGF
jgi:hypothetical protein